MSDETPAAEGTFPPEAAPSTSRSTSIEERRRLVAESLRVGNPGNHARELPLQADPIQDCPIELPVEAIRPYEHNPRRMANARFEEIKASIRACGIRTPLTVTRRPGETHFIVEAGGNTRLLALQQLWAETGDARFQKLTVLFRPWRSETQVLTAHLIENEQRGELGFWDKANGIAVLKARLEADSGQCYSLRQLEEALRGLGLPVNTATLSHCLFATERLRTLGEAIPRLTGLDVKTLQPRLNALKRHAQARASMTEDVLYESVFEPVFHRTADAFRGSGAFHVDSLSAACEEALAASLGESVAQMRAAINGTDDSQATPPGDAATDEKITSSELREPEQQQSLLLPGTTPVSTANIRTSPLERLTEQARRFAALAGVGELLRLNAAAPLGFFMEAPPAGDDRGADSSPPRRAWWLLAAAAGQLDDTATMPAADSVTGAFPAPALDAQFVGWLLDPGDEAAAAFWKMAGLIRALRSDRRMRAAREGEDGRAAS